MTSFVAQMYGMFEIFDICTLEITVVLKLIENIQIFKNSSVLFCLKLYSCNNLMQNGVKLKIDSNALKKQ